MTEQPEKLSKYWGKQEPNPLANKEIRDYAEELIQAAMAEGKFKNLPGKGKPLNLGWEHPWEEKDWMSNHILSNAHIVPEWVNLQKQITAELEWLRAHPKHEERAERITQINQVIDRFNLLVPAGFMQVPRYLD